MDRRLLLLIGGFLLILTLAAILYFIPAPKTRTALPDDTHFHAGFVLIDNGQMVDFSGLEYMHVKPCGDEDDPEDDQIEKAHLHDSVGNVVHVHRDNATWGDLFRNINYPLNSASISAYLNGQEQADILSYPIKPYDSIVIVKNNTPNPENFITSAVEQQTIIDAEKLSENCGS